jgi:hypothetical protein
MLLDRDELLRRLWRLPVWPPLVAALDRHGGRILPRIEVPPPPASPPPALDIWMERAGGRPPPEGRLWAGAATADITPPAGCNLAGFGFSRRASGVRDPLFARVLALSDGQRPMLLVAMDLIGLSLPRAARLRARLARRHAGGVWLVSTHNHQSPDTLGLWGPGLLGALPLRSGLDLAYMERLETQVLQAVDRALGAIRPARLFAGSAPFDPQGRLVHNEKSPVLDRELRVLELRADDGRAVASLVQHACHPETLWKDGTRVSADFCGVCCRRVEAELGGVGLYLNGALGAMVSAAVGHETLASTREALLTQLGEALGRAAVELARGGAVEVSAPVVRTFRRTVRLPADESNLYRLLLGLGVVERRPIEAGLETEVSLARLGPVSLLGLPGEPAPALGLELLARVPGEPRLLVGLCNDELGYLLPEAFFGDPMYAYETRMTPGPSAAGRLRAAVVELAAEAVA